MGCSCGQASAANQPGGNKSRSKGEPETHIEETAAPETDEIGVVNYEDLWGVPPKKTDEEHHAIVFEVVLTDQTLDEFQSTRQQEFCAHVKTNLGCDSVEVLRLREGSVIAETCAVGFVHEEHVEEAADKIRQGSAIERGIWGSHSIPKPVQLTKTRMHRGSGCAAIAPPAAVSLSSRNATPAIGSTTPADASKPPAPVVCPTPASPPAAAAVLTSLEKLQREASGLSDGEGSDPAFPPVEEKKWRYGQLNGSLLMSGTGGCRTPPSDDEDAEWLRKLQPPVAAGDKELLTDVEDTCVNLEDLDNDLQVDFGNHNRRR